MATQGKVQRYLSSLDNEETKAEVTTMLATVRSRKEHGWRPHSQGSCERAGLGWIDMVLKRKQFLRKLGGGVAASRPRYSSRATGSEQGGHLSTGTLSAGLCDTVGL